MFVGVMSLFPVQLTAVHTPAIVHTIPVPFEIENSSEAVPVDRTPPVRTPLVRDSCSPWCAVEIAVWVATIESISVEASVQDSTAPAASTPRG